MLLHLVLTVDVVLIDEIGQESAEVIAALDIIFRKARNSTTPFGGVLILGTLDHTQCQPINAMTFLMSSLLMTCFTFVVLNESVRAAEDELEFQEFQRLTWMSPTKLISDPSHKVGFYELMDIFQFADNWNDPRITRHVIRMLS